MYNQRQLSYTIGTEISWRSDSNKLSNTRPKREQFFLNEDHEQLCLSLVKWSYEILSFFFTLWSFFWPTCLVKVGCHPTKTKINSLLVLFKIPQHSVCVVWQHINYKLKNAYRKVTRSSRGLSLVCVCVCDIMLYRFCEANVSWRSYKNLTLPFFSSSNLKQLTVQVYIPCDTQFSLNHEFNSYVRILIHRLHSIKAKAK